MWLSRLMASVTLILLACYDALLQNVVLDPSKHRMIEIWGPTVLHFLFVSSCVGLTFIRSDIFVATNDEKLGGYSV